MPNHSKSSASTLEPGSKNVSIVVAVIIIAGLAIYFLMGGGNKLGSGQGGQATSTAPLGEFYIENPRVTEPLQEKEIPRGVIKLSISTSGFNLNEFTVKSGQAVSITLTSRDGGTHILEFESPKLENVKIAVAGNTRGISFITPEPGDYTFYCSVPGHKKAGEIGIMHVE